jgi:hypothetical protein
MLGTFLGLIDGMDYLDFLRKICLLIFTGLGNGLHQ